MTELSSARVRVPCSTSNLGAGFDTLGLALDRFLDVSFTPDSSGALRVVREGTLRALLEDETDIVAEILKRRVADVDVSGVLKMHSDIPVGRGLGASAAARVAGYELALAVQGLPRDDAATFDSAYRQEGHGDNAAPSLFGGLRAVARRFASTGIKEPWKQGRSPARTAAPSATSRTRTAIASPLNQRA